MLIPRFSLRLLLAIITFSSLFFFIVMLATRGHDWALGVTIAVTSLFAVLAFHAVVFSLAWTMTMMGGLFGKRQIADTPFATAKPPPQLVVPPEDHE